MGETPKIFKYSRNFSAFLSSLSPSCTPALQNISDFNNYHPNMDIFNVSGPMLSTFLTLSSTAPTLLLTPLTHLP